MQGAHQGRRPVRPAGAGDEHEESPVQRAQRNFSELIQELRVAGLGIQVLFGFLLALPFEDQHFTSLTGEQHALFIVAVSLAALSTVALGAPVAYHRIVFRRHEKERLVRVSNALALAGLTLVALTVSCSVALVMSQVVHNWLAALLSAVVFGAFAAFWLVVPLVGRELG